ncbi:MAG: segregation/condensation protein A [Cyanobacteria bacterium J083]|nr:MAG: segregation/condensation protein A [Cyanobacteria bacterium J083]
MKKDGATHAIAILIDLAQAGEINPWDVDVIKVIDRFLAEIELTSPQPLDHIKTDLPESGQAFLWASMLVLFKADTLEASQVEELEEELLEPEMAEGELSRLPFNKLENHIRRRSTPAPIRQRKVTLEELIGQIKHISEEIEQQSQKRPSKRKINPRASSRAAITAISSLANNENLTEIAHKLEKFLMLQFSRLAAQEQYIDLEKLLEWWIAEKKEQHNELDINHNSDKVGIFWSLLLLSAQSKVELSQREFYQELKIRPLVS